MVLEYDHLKKWPYWCQCHYCHNSDHMMQEVTITPGEDEEVVELTLETRHMLPVLSAIVGLAAAIYALIFYTNV